MVKLPLWFCLVAGVAFGASAPADTMKPIVLDGTRQLFLDDYLIAQADNVQRVIHPARKYEGNPVLWDKDAGGDVMYASVIRDEGKFRMWYARRRQVCYAESPDGIKWTQPILDVVTLNGEKTNIVTGSSEREKTDPPTWTRTGPSLPYFSQIVGVQRNPGSPNPAQRYTLGYISIQSHYTGPSQDPYHANERRGFGIAFSPDGYQWTLRETWATETVIDGPEYWLWDDARQKYLLYGRTKFISPAVSDAWGLHGLPIVPMTPEQHAYVKKTHWGRAVARAESPDLLNWDIHDAGKSPMVLTADTFDPPGFETYGMYVFKYQGLYIGLVKVWRRTPDGGPLEIQLAVSRDSFHFERVGDRAAFIPVGGVGEWDRFNQSVMMNEPVPNGDELRFYYSGQTARHFPYAAKDTGALGSGIGFAAVTRDRFVSLAASFDGGTITTKPLQLGGGTLHVNAKSDFGGVTIEVLDENGKAVAKSKPFRGDTLDGKIEWESGALPAAGSAVKLKITLSNAHLYAIWAS